MGAENLKQEAHRAWYEYGEAIKDTFRFPKDSRIVSEPLVKVISSDDEERIHRFIVYVQGQTQNLRKMRGPNG